MDRRAAKRAVCARVAAHLGAQGPPDTLHGADADRWQDAADDLIAELYRRAGLPTQGEPELDGQLSLLEVLANEGADPAAEQMDAVEMRR